MTNKAMLGLYRGLSPISWAIKKQTRSIYSHEGVIMPDMKTVYEAWTSGVVKNKHWSIGHRKNTIIDFYEILVPFDQELLVTFLDAHVGDKYDFRSIFRFLSHKRNRSENDRWFCSEYGNTAFCIAGATLLGGWKSEQAPAHTAISPLIWYDHSKVCGKTGRYDFLASTPQANRGIKPIYIGA